MKHYNIPIFTPHLACPHTCIFCNQRHISGQTKVPNPQEVIQTIEQYLATLKPNSEVQVAFFGGSFTCLDASLQEQYLQVVQPYIKAQKIKSIRLSTRPDYIDEKTLERLKYYGVEDIELGAQSLDDQVLSHSQRGHSVKDIERASRLINSYGFRLGLQMMLGLPLDTMEKSILSAKKILELGAKTTRIYPTLVIENTYLAQLYRQGLYTPLSLNEGVEWAKEVYKIFENEDITVLRVGLHPSKDLINGSGLLAGPFHVSFFELVKTALWREKIIQAGQTQNQILVPKEEINYFVGYKSSNKNLIKEKYPNLKPIFI